MYVPYRLKTTKLISMKISGHLQIGLADGPVNLGSDSGDGSGIER